MYQRISNPKLFLANYLKPLTHTELDPDHAWVPTPPRSGQVLHPHSADQPGWESPVNSILCPTHLSHFFNSAKRIGFLLIPSIFWMLKPKLALKSTKVTYIGWDVCQTKNTIRMLKLLLIIIDVWSKIESTNCKNVRFLWRGITQEPANLS